MQFPDTIWDKTHTWQNTNDRVEYERTLAAPDSYQNFKMAQAMLASNPLTPSREIRKYGNTPVVPPRFGYRVDAIGISDVTAPGAVDHLFDRAPTDFSGSVSGYQGSSFPSLGN